MTTYLDPIWEGEGLELAQPITGVSMTGGSGRATFKLLGGTTLVSPTVSIADSATLHIDAAPDALTEGTWRLQIWAEPVGEDEQMVAEYRLAVNPAP